MIRIVGCCLILIITAGCTGATPEFETLNEDGIPRPTFNGSYLKNIVTGDGAATFAISGECSSKIRAIYGMPVGPITSFGTLNALAVSGASVTCSSDGKFSFTLKSLTDLGFSLTEGTVYEIQLRGETSAGISKASSIKILYSTTAGATRPIRITSGGIIGAGDGTLAVGADTGTFKANIRVTHKLNAMSTTQASSEDAYLKSGSNFKARIGIRNDF